jgi:hypothetical protein
MGAFSLLISNALNSLQGVRLWRFSADLTFLTVLLVTCYLRLALFLLLVTPSLLLFVVVVVQRFQS